MADSSDTVTLSQKDFNLFRELIYREAGISLGDAKHQLVSSRLAKRLRALDLDSYGRYYDYLMNHDRDGQERLRMINSLTTNKTDFFRENHHFEYLRKTVFPLLEARARETGNRRIRIWSAACSTGEEPYTIAMTVLDHFGPTSFHGWDIRILASDVDTDVLAHAQKGVYAADRVAEIPREILKRHFLTSKDPEAPVQIRPELQELIAFRRINFIEPNWPIHTLFDIIFCRNVMIYFDEQTQDRLLTRFSTQLQPEGHLFIGHSESILRLDHLYKSLGNTIYRLSPGVGAASKAAKSTAPESQAVARTSAADQDSSRQNNGGSGSGLRKTPGRIRTQSPPVATRLASPTELREIRNHPIIVGEVKASADPLRVTTLLGSCIAVCLFDPKVCIGGMNHFMLPSSSTNDAVCATYGIHAMELLINEIMKLGGDRRRLVAKVFGGGNVLGRKVPADPRMAIGDRNTRFALEFLATDAIPIIGQNVGGTSGRQVQFLTHTGQAFVKPIQKTEVEEIQAPPAPEPQPVGAGSVELF